MKTKMKNDKHYNDTVQRTPYIHIRASSLSLEYLIQFQLGHSLERERPSRAHFHARTSKILAQSSTRTKRDLGTILWAIDENMGTNLQALYSCLQTQKHKLYAQLFEQLLYLLGIEFSSSWSLK